MCLSSARRSPLRGRPASRHAIGAQPICCDAASGTTMDAGNEVVGRNVERRPVRHHSGCAPQGEPTCWARSRWISQRGEAPDTASRSVPGAMFVIAVVYLVGTRNRPPSTLPWCTTTSVSHACLEPLLPIPGSVRRCSAFSSCVYLAIAIIIFGKILHEGIEHAVFMAACARLPACGVSIPAPRLA